MASLPAGTNAFCAGHGTHSRRRYGLVDFIHCFVLLIGVGYVSLHSLASARPTRLFHMVTDHELVFESPLLMPGK
jgi:hypothetical protein